MTTSTSATPSFSLEREWLDLVFRRARLDSREFVTDTYARVRVAGDELAGFGSVAGADDHVRIFLPDAPPATVDEMRQAPSREFTPVQWGTGEDGVPFLDLEFALHGDEGVASRWAAHASIGAPIGIGGPRATTHLRGTPNGWFLAGDETAIAQIRRYAALIPEGAPALILVEVRGAAHQVPINAPVPVAFVPRKNDAPGTALAAALANMDEDDKPGDDPFVFVAAEQGVVKAARALAVGQWGVDPARAIIKGYWKAGDTEYHAPH